MIFGYKKQWTAVFFFYRYFVHARGIIILFWPECWLCRFCTLFWHDFIVIMYFYWKPIALVSTHTPIKIYNFGCHSLKKDINSLISSCYIVSLAMLNSMANEKLMWPMKKKTFICKLFSHPFQFFPLSLLFLCSGMKC